MNVGRTLTAVFFVAALAVLLPRLAWTFFDTFVLGHADSKFGAQGGVEFVAFFVGIAAAIAGVVATILAVVRIAMRYTVHLLTALLGGLALSCTSFWIPDLAVYGIGYGFFGEVGMIMVNWAAVCAAVFVLVQLAIGGRLPPNSNYTFGLGAREIQHVDP